MEKQPGDSKRPICTVPRWQGKRTRIMDRREKTRIKPNRTGHHGMQHLWRKRPRGSTVPKQPANKKEGIGFQGKCYNCNGKGHGRSQCPPRFALNLNSKRKGKLSELGEGNEWDQRVSIAIVNEQQQTGTASTAQDGGALRGIFLGGGDLRSLEYPDMYCEPCQLPKQNLCLGEVGQENWQTVPSKNTNKPKAQQSTMNMRQLKYVLIQVPLNG